MIKDSSKLEGDSESSLLGLTISKVPLISGDSMISEISDTEAIVGLTTLKEDLDTEHLALLIMRGFSSKR
ncbi:6699_t:CDS:2 [Entrophospora sp. SA101]|nr:6699_t:CDS:2 [Entrophospora sp. SA101]CAJ0916680.1 18941_t:CDS:2 [Entrophospora sp. SA101]